MRPRPAGIVFALVLTSAPGTRAADLPEQRLACQQESRRHISGPRRLDAELYRRVIERRQLYVLNCMTNGPRDVGQTGSLPVPLPPRRPKSATWASANLDAQE